MKAHNNGTKFTETSVAGNGLRQKIMNDERIAYENNAEQAPGLF